MKISRKLTTALAGATLLTSTALASIASAETTIRYAIWDQSQAPALQNIIDAYEAENPDIDVVLEVTPWGKYWPKLQTEAGNDNLPDVFWMNPFNFPLYATEGVILPIDDLVEASGFDAEAIPQIMRDIYTNDGQLYSLPNNRDAIIVWYNKAIFEAAGVEEPQEGWTWEDFQNIAAALTDAEKGVWGTAAYLNFRQVWINTIAQAGGAVLSDDAQTALWDTPEVATGVKFWADIAQAGSSPTVDQLSDTDQFSMFLSGKLGMLYAGSWMGVSFSGSDLAASGDLAIAQLPAGPNGNMASTSSLGNVIGATTDHLDEAYAFVEFLGGKTAADIYTQGGIALSAYPEFDSNFIAFYEGKFDAQPIADQIENVFGLPREEGLANLDAEMQTALDAE